MPLTLSAAEAGSMPPTAAQVRRILVRLNGTRRSEQRNSLQILEDFARTPAGRQAVIAAGGVAALLQFVGGGACNGSGSGSGSGSATCSCCGSGSGSQTAAGRALTVLMDLNRGNDSPLAEEWEAAMLAAGAVPILVQHLGGGCVFSQHAAAYMLGELCHENSQTAAAAVQHGAGPLLAAAVRGPWDLRVPAAAFALCSLVHTTQVAGSLLRDGVAEALVHLMLSRTEDEQAQVRTAWMLTDLARGSEARGLAVARRGGLRALVHLVQHGGESAARAAAQALSIMATDAPSVQAAAIAGGAIPALEACLQAHQDSPEVSRWAPQLLDTLRAAQQAQQQAQLSAAGTAGSGSDSPSSASQAAAATCPAAPATPRRARRRAPHLCSWCGVDAPAGMRFKKCAACQQVGNPVI